MNKVKYVVRKRAMGDVLWTEPVIRALAERNKKVIVYTKHPVLFENFPYSNTFFRNELSLPEKILIASDKILGTNLYSIRLDGAYERRPSLHFLHAYQQEAKLPLTEEYPKLYLSAKEKTARPIEPKYVVLHIESFADKKYRQVFGIDWEEVVRFFTSQGLVVIQVGIKDGGIKGTKSLKTSVRELITLIYHADFFVGIDSGPSHIAASLGIKSLILFGAIDPALRHFPNVINGILLKQPCEVKCTTFDVDKEEMHYCDALIKDGIPRCCVYSTATVIFYLQQLLRNNV